MSFFLADETDDDAETSRLSVPGRLRAVPIVCIEHVDSSINRHNRLMVLRIRSYILRFLGISLGRSSGIECWETMRKMWESTG